MISIIIFVVAVVLIYFLNLIVFFNSMHWWTICWILLLAVVGMILINAIIAIMCSKWFPDKWFQKQNKFYSASKKECRFYEKLGIKKWKDKILELGALNNFRKNKIIMPYSVDYVKKFIIENNKGYLTHFVSCIVSLLAIFIMPIKFWLPMALPVGLTSFIINLQPLMVLKYNMPRLQVLLKYAQRKENAN